METEHFQAPFRVITLGSIQIENNQTEEVNCMAALKLASYQRTQAQTEDDNADFYVFENEAVNIAKQLWFVKKNLAAFLACHIGSLSGK